MSPNLVKRLQVMNSKSFVHLYDDGLQVEEIEKENLMVTRNTKMKNYQTRGTQPRNTC